MKNKNNFWPRRKIILKEIILREEQSLIEYLIDWEDFFLQECFFYLRKKTSCTSFQLNEKEKKMKRNKSRRIILWKFEKTFFVRVNYV